MNLRVLNSIRKWVKIGLKSPWELRNASQRAMFVQTPARAAGEASSRSPSRASFKADIFCRILLPFQIALLQWNNCPLSFFEAPFPTSYWLKHGRAHQASPLFLTSHWLMWPRLLVLFFCVLFIGHWLPFCTCCSSTSRSSYATGSLTLS